jgi:hypothetical protein
MTSEHPSPEDILRKAGFALVITQRFEYDLTMLCQILNLTGMTTSKTDPTPDNSLLGLAKARTPALRKLQAALSEVGISGEHDLATEIEDFIKFRDWLAHRMFIEIAETRSETRRFQNQTLDEWIEKGKRLLGKLHATSKHLAEKSLGEEDLPHPAYMAELAFPFLEDAKTLVSRMSVSAKLHR